MSPQEARARQEQVSAQLLSETAMAQAQRDFQVQQALCDAAVNARKAQADLAYQLQVRRNAWVSPGCPLGVPQVPGSPP